GEQDGDQAETEDQKIAAENFDYQPPGNTRRDRQRNVNRAQEYLVRNRIEIRADAGGNAEAPRQRPVDHVGECRGKHDSQSAPVLRAQNRTDGEWNKRQPRQCEQVRDIYPSWCLRALVAVPLRVHLWPTIWYYSGTTRRPKMKLRILTVTLI